MNFRAEHDSGVKTIPNRVENRFLLKIRFFKKFETFEKSRFGSEPASPWSNGAENKTVQIFFDSPSIGGVPGGPRAPKNMKKSIFLKNPKIMIFFNFFF